MSPSQGEGSGSDSHRPLSLVSLITMKVLPVKPTIQFEDLEKLDIRVGKIEKVEDVANSDKLIKLTVDFGSFKRIILVGMKKERENPQEIEGIQALFVVNLAPKKMAGEISEGMLFDIGYANEITPVLAVPEKEVPNGVNAG
jgi:tRNA-binding protein